MRKAKVSETNALRIAEAMHSRLRYDKRKQRWTDGHRFYADIYRTWQVWCRREEDRRPRSLY